MISQGNTGSQQLVVQFFRTPRWQLSVRRRADNPRYRLPTYRRVVRQRLDSIRDTEIALQKTMSTCQNICEPFGERVMTVTDRIEVNPRVMLGN